MAQVAGLIVPRRSLTRVGGKAVLLLDRFDRSKTGARVAYMSAMTMLTARDGQSSEFDYVELAEALSENGDVTIRDDLVEMWRRIAFTVAIHSTDDHLRNHGLLRGTAGWSLSPLLYVNPDPDIGKERKLGISAAHAHADEIDGLKAAAPSFGLRGGAVRAVLADVFAATSDWRQVVTSNGIRERERSLMKDAFDGLRHLVT